MKKCTVCKETKDLDSFYKRKTSRDGLLYRCKVCDNKAVQDYRSSNKDAHRKTMRNTNLKQRYGVDMLWYSEAFKAQGNSCAICKATKNTVTGKSSEWSFAVDHCHNTNKIRGILCNQCNRALGLFRDSTETLEAALNYLKEHEQ